MNPAPGIIDYKKICFVIMPFKKKMVDGVEIDFDKIYDDIFKPAIAAVQLPEGGNLIPKRTDKDYFAANIDVEMFQYLEYSRFALVDITGLNPNVFYELGIRHHANESGTAMFRQLHTKLPFDISRIKAFPYEYEPVDKIKESIKLVTDVLTDSLIYNRLDSPVQIALAAQYLQAPKIDPYLIEATNAMRNGDPATAITNYEKAIRLDPKNPLLLQEKGLLLKRMSKWDKAAADFQGAVKLSPEYSEAWRELGISQNKIYNDKKDPALPSGEDALKEAIRLNGEDFDAYASLGGVYKRFEKYEEAAAMYNKSLDISRGHSYPLLNAIILQVRQKGAASVTPKQKLYMKRAELQLKKQVTDNPPYNAPWSFFDLSTIYLFLGDDQALTILEEGLQNMANDWEAKTHLNTLKLIENRVDELPGLKQLVDLLEAVV
jgi:tetratricopeptide (TPR) repeat protein